MCRHVSLPFLYPNSLPKKQLNPTTCAAIKSTPNSHELFRGPRTPCRAQGISCKCLQVYKSPNLFRGLFSCFVRQAWQIGKAVSGNTVPFADMRELYNRFYTGTNQVLMSDNPKSQRFLEFFLEGLKELFHSYYKSKGLLFYCYAILLYLLILLILQNVSKRTFSVQKSFYAGTFLSFSIADLHIRLTDCVVIW